MKCVRWIEPGEDGVTPVTKRLPVEQAIAQQKEIAAARNYVYATDEQALGDFMVVNWADIEELPTCD